MTTFFVGGCMRTGTSLLTSILCSDPSTNPMIAEVQYLTQMVGSYRWGKQFFTESLSDTFETPDDFKQFNQHWVGDYLKRTRERFSPCTHLVLKNPQMTRYFPEVHELIDDAKFLVIVRDPRDTIVSIMEVARKQMEAGQETIYTKMRNDMKQMSIYYGSYYAPIFNRSIPSLKRNTLLLRYEDLVSDVSGVVAEIARFTGLRLTDFDPDAEWRRSSIDSERRKDSPVLSPWRTELRGKPISSQRIGRFRERLTRDQVAIIERECADYFRGFGYQATTGPIPDAN